MALPRLYNLARVLSSTVGTGTLTLGPSVQGFLTFAQAGVPNGTQVSYGIRDGANSEVGIGTYATIGPTLTRDIVTNSTNLGAYINLSGSEEVYITARAEDIQAVVDLSNSLAPFDAMAYSGMQINGGMEVSQESGTTQLGVQNASRYIVDGWALTSFGAQVVTGYQPSAPSTLPGYGSSMEFFVAAANASPTGVEQATFEQKIEGVRVSRLAWGTASASPITISFWVKAVRTGLYCGSVRNGAVNRTYVFTFTVTATNTWEYKTVTMPGDTAGVWDKYNTTGLVLNFTPMAGPTLVTTANVWTAGNFLAASGAVNGVAATSDVFSITGVTVLPGTQAPTAAQSPNIMRPYDQELMTCQRYFNSFTDLTLYSGWVAASASVINTFTIPSMRATPTFLLGALNTNNNAASNPIVFTASSNSIALHTTAVATGAVWLAFNAKFDARL